MSQFSFKTLEQQGLLVVNMEGSIGEDFSLKAINLFTARRIRLNFEKIISINTQGLRAWVQWIKTVNAQQILFEKCPRCIIEQINFVKDFVTDKCKVESFFVPYYSQTSDEEKSVLYEIFKDYRYNDTVTVRSEKDSAGTLMVLDIIPEKYFAFLNPKKKIELKTSS